MLDHFTHPLRLDPQNAWYCSVCKDHKEGTKKDDVWLLPNVLIFHLKRFEYTLSFARFPMAQKIRMPVHAPIDGLDLSR